MTMNRATTLALKGAVRILPMPKKRLSKPKKDNLLGTSASPVKLSADNWPDMRAQLRLTTSF